MIVLNFNGQSFEENRKMVFEIRQEVFNYSLNKNDGAPYSLALALDLEEPGIITGTIYKKNVRLTQKETDNNYKILIIFILQIVVVTLFNIKSILENVVQTLIFPIFILTIFDIYKRLVFNTNNNYAPIK